MLRVFRARVVTLLVLLAAPIASAEQSPRAENSIVAVFTLRDGRVVTSGTGFVLGNGRHVVTATHLAIHSGMEMRVVPGDGDMSRLDLGYRARIVRADEIGHIAILEVFGLRAPGLPLQLEPVSVNAEFLVPVYPRAQGAVKLPHTLSRAKASVRTVRGENPSSETRPLIHIATEPMLGSMGSPLLDRCGNVVGVIVLGYYGSPVHQAAAAADIAAVARAHKIPVAIAERCQK